MRLETERLILDKIHPDDIEPLTSLWSDPDVTLHSGGPRSPENLRKIFQEALQQQEPTLEWIVRLKENNQFLGHCDILEKEIDGIQELELIYYFAKSSWNRGYATEAARAVLQHSLPKIKNDRVVALIHPENLASETVAMKLGFKLDRVVQRQSGPRKLYLLPTR